MIFAAGNDLAALLNAQSPCYFFKDPLSPEHMILQCRSDVRHLSVTEVAQWCIVSYHTVFNTKIRRSVVCCTMHCGILRLVASTLQLGHLLQLFD